MKPELAHDRVNFTSRKVPHHRGNTDAAIGESRHRGSREARQHPLRAGPWLVAPRSMRLVDRGYADYETKVTGDRVECLVGHVKAASIITDGGGSKK